MQGSTALHGAAFDAAWAAAPKDQPAGDSALTPEPGFLQARISGLPAAWQGQKLEFFPESPGLIEPGAAWTQTWDGNRWTARIPLSAQRSDSPAQVPLVLALANQPGEGPGAPGVRLQAPVQGSWPPAAPLPAAVSPELQKALEAIRHATSDALRLYPDPNADTLKAALAQHHGVKANQVFVGNGSDEVLAHAFLALLKRERPLLFPDITYSFYPVYCRLYGIPWREMPLDADYAIDIADYCGGEQGGDSGGIVIANPNAPTGIADAAVAAAVDGGPPTIDGIAPATTTE